jgi:hypothetical protein
MKLVRIICLAVTLSACAAEPTTDEEQRAPVDIATTHTDDYDAYAACMDRCDGFGYDPGWGVRAIDYCDAECRPLLNTPSGGKTPSRRIPKYLTQ